MLGDLKDKVSWDQVGHFVKDGMELYKVFFKVSVEGVQVAYEIPNSHTMRKRWLYTGFDRSPRYHRSPCQLWQHLLLEAAF